MVYAPTKSYSFLKLVITLILCNVIILTIFTLVNIRGNINILIAYYCILFTKLLNTNLLEHNFRVARQRHNENHIEQETKL